MKAARDYPILTVTAKGTRWLESGHPWVYDSDVAREPDESECENGALVDVVSEKGKYLGTGFLSRLSKLRVRIVSRNANDRFDENFWRRRVRYAWDYRKAVMDGQTGCCRLIFGEADAFPGLTVDRFENLLVTQTLSLGMEKIKDMLFPLIVEVLEQDGETIDGLFERNDVVLREKEGLTQNKGWFPLPGKKTPESPITEICENGVFYRVDVENGQKTGFFLDQKFNRLAVAHLAHGKRVLDCFTHTGSFALNAAKGGAEHVTAVDVSESAIEMARANAARNGLEDKMDFLAADVFDLLPQLEAAHEKPYDFIILDPPAFTKSRRTANNAEKGYKEINLRAMRLLPRGGYLATASCSHFMPAERFERMLRSAAADAGVELVYVPFCYDAFVFMVNEKNPVTSLTAQQIRQIYTGQYSSWEALGGESQKLYAYQRPHGSGSQTAMEEMVMQGLELQAEENYISIGMDDAVRQIGNYDNGIGAIGYSYLYYVNKLVESSGIRVLAIDGIAPTTENLQSGAYPYTVNYYAVYRKGDSNTEAFVNWLISDAGQLAVRQAGYVPLR